MCGTYNTYSQIKLLKSSLCDYSNAYITVKWTVKVKDTGTATAPNNRNKEAVFENCPPFTYCISEINNTQIDNVKDIDIVINMYGLIEYSENYSQASGSLEICYRNQRAL